MDKRDGKIRLCSNNMKVIAWDNRYLGTIISRVIT